MTYKKQKEISGEDIQIDTDNLIEKTECYLNIKYSDELKYKAVSIENFDYNSGCFIVKLSDSRCNHVLGFIDGLSDDGLKIYITTKFAWVIEPDEGEIKIGDYIQPSDVNGFMKICQNQEVGKSTFRIGINVHNESDNMLRQKIVGYDRAGLLFEPMLDDDGNVVFEKLPQTRFVSIDGKPSEEYKYYADIKRCSTMKDLKSKKLDMNAVEKQKIEDNNRLSRLSRSTKSVSISQKAVHPMLQRRDSGTSFLTRRSSGTNLLLSSRSSSTKEKEPMIEPVKRSIFKAYLLPIF